MGRLTGAGTAHGVPCARVLADAGADPVTGLGTAEAARRLARDGPNDLAVERGDTLATRLARQARDPLVLLLVVAAVVAAAVWWVEGAVGPPYDVLVILVVVVANTVLATVQEGRSARAVEALRALSVAPSCVVRDGTLLRLESTRVVVGDLLVLTEGDAVTADGRVVASSGLVVVEAALTGESEPVTKGADPVPAATDLADRRSMVFAGTAVASGTGHVVVTATGADTETGRVAGLLAAATKRSSPLEQEIAAVGATLAKVVPVVAAGVVLLLLATSSGAGDLHGLVAALLVGVSLAVAAVPEGLPAVVTLVLALGMTRMAARHAVVRRLAAVETLGSTSVLCTDKTGTLTTGDMTVREVVGPLPPDGPTDPAVVRDVLRAAVLAGDARSAVGSTGTRDVGDPVDVAILRRARRCDGAVPAGAEVLGRYPFTAERRRATTVYRVGAGPCAHVAVKGAPDVVTALCDRVRVGCADLPWDDVLRDRVQAHADALTGAGLRTLAVAGRTVAGPPAVAVDPEQNLVLLGFVCLADPVRPDVPEAVRRARRAGVEVLMVTGDHPRTAAAVAREVGILGPEDGPDDRPDGASEDGGRVVTGHRLRETGDDALRNLVRHARVFARVVPEDKLRIVAALQQGGHVVAMTGDGVNDAPALRAADVGVAMGAGGTQVARDAADVVLTDDAFPTIVRAVEEGRAIYDNIQTFLRYLLSSNLAEILTMAVGVALGACGVPFFAAGAPLLAAQILWVNLLTDTAPALALGVEAADPDVMRRHPRPPGRHLLDGGVLAGVVALAVVIAASTLTAFAAFSSQGAAVARTAAFTTLVLAQLVNVLVVRARHRSAFARRPPNHWLAGAVGLSLVLQVLVVHVPLLNAVCRTVPLTPAQWLVCAALAGAVLVFHELRRLPGTFRPGHADGAVAPWT